MVASATVDDTQQAALLWTVNMVVLVDKHAATAMHLPTPLCTEGMYLAGTSLYRTASVQQLTGSNHIQICSKRHIALMCNRCRGACTFSPITDARNPSCAVRPTKISFFLLKPNRVIPRNFLGSAGVILGFWLGPFCLFLTSLWFDSLKVGLPGLSACVTHVHQHAQQ